MESHK